MLPEVRPSSAILARPTRPCFGRPIPIAGVAGDQQAATFGQACFAPGRGQEHVRDRRVPAGQRGRVARRLGARAAVDGALAAGRAGPGRLRARGLGVRRRRGRPVAARRPPRGVERGRGRGARCAASRTRAGSTSCRRSSASAPRTGIRTPAACSSASRAGPACPRSPARRIESIAYQVDDVLEAMAADRGAPLTDLRVDGGAARNDDLLRFQADLLGVPVERPRVTETTAWGAASLAGLAIGLLGIDRGARRDPGRRPAVRARDGGRSAGRAARRLAARGGPLEGLGDRLAAGGGRIRAPR